MRDIGGVDKPPVQFCDRWRHRSDPLPGQRFLYWHVLVGGQPAVTDLARLAQQRVASFDGLHMTPLEWLHITMLAGGPADQVPASGLEQMIHTASQQLCDTEPLSVSIGRLVYHPEGILLAVEPEEALTPIRDAVRAATSAVAKYDGKDDSPWMPHITLCYSTASQPMEPVIAALGPALPGREIRIDTVSLVIQHGSERLWDWRVAGTVRLGASPARCHDDGLGFVTGRQRRLSDT